MDNINYKNTETITIEDNSTNNGDISLTPKILSSASITKDEIFKQDNNSIKIKIKKPKLNNKKVPFDDLNLLANSKKLNISDNVSNTDSDINIDDELENQIDSLNNNTISNKNIPITIDNSTYDDADDDDADDDDDDDDDDDSYNSNNNKFMPDNGNMGESDDDDVESEHINEPELSYEDIQKMKSELIYKLSRLEQSGYKASRKYTMASNLDDIKFEHDTIKRQRDIDKSIKFSRKMLIGLIGGIEFINEKADLVDLKLTGWSEQTMESLGDYDEVFEELHDKYGETVKMSPEIKLLMMVAGSGFMFHITQAMFKSSTPEVSDILRQNPDIMQSISKAAMNNMSQQYHDTTQTSQNDDPIMSMMMGGIENSINNLNNSKQPTF